jgi:MOSC domain-containing protein YiiM
MRGEEDEGAPGRVMSVNIGTPIEVPHRGRMVSTGIFKSPVAGPLALRTLGLEGDGQADLRAHGGPDRAAYVYRWEDYEWWMEALGHRLAPGELGENLTVEGLGGLDIHVGDRFRLGEALIEASSPRVPCFKLGIRMGDASFPARFRAAGRSGFYARVIEEGRVAPGDGVERVVHRSDLPLVEDLAALMAAGGGDLAALRRAVAAPPLPEGWRSWCRERIARIETGSDDGVDGAAAVEPAEPGARSG